MVAFRAEVAFRVEVARRDAGVRVNAMDRDPILDLE